MKYALDVTDDYSFKELYSFLDSSTTPDWVKQGECTIKAAVHDLPAEAFADQYHRAFPIHTAPDVYISNAYFMNKKAELINLWGEHYAKSVEDRITKAAEVFDIKHDLSNYNTNLSEKSAKDYTESSVASFDLVGTSYDLFPYKTADDIKYQAQEFATNIKNYPFAWRTKIAAEFIEKASSLGVNELPDIICKYGGMCFPDVREFQDTLIRRMHKLSEEYQAKYQPIIDKAASVSSREEAFNICGEAYKIEKEAGVYEKPLVYREMGDIVDRTMTLNMSKLAELFDTVKMGGEYYNIKDLQQVNKDIYKQAFECEIDPEKVAELKEILPTMPASDIALFRELSGINPIQ